MHKYTKAQNLAKAATLSGWAGVLRDVLAQAKPNYRALRERIEAVIQEMTDRAKEWEMSTHNHLDRN